MDLKVSGKINKIPILQIGDLIYLHDFAAHVYEGLNSNKLMLAMIVNIEKNILKKFVDGGIKRLKKDLSKEDYEIIKDYDVVYTVVCQNKILEVTVADIDFDKK
jgi:hypothetical protein